MSGCLVDIIGGPLDGRQRHRQLSTGGAEEIVADAGNGYVHVWIARRAPAAPFEYQGTRRATRYDGNTCVSWGVRPLLGAVGWRWKQGDRARAVKLLRHLPAAIAWSVKHRGLTATWHRPPTMLPSWREQLPEREVAHA